ncbi:MAG: hypothetical protein AMJ81_11215 [Phycisphaerae bacterium SM23_33]|nr:MAG: hypothetical protein AMJ81_11215 [Phycisphaerae bacterium SM23_33]
MSALGVLLMAAGWLLWRRRRGAAACHLIYAVSMMMLATACCCAFTLSAWSRWGWMSGLSGRYFSGRMVGSSLLELAFPVFLLAWFTRPKIRGQVRSWSRPGRRMELPWPNR